MPDELAGWLFVSRAFMGSRTFAKVVSLDTPMFPDVMGHLDTCAAHETFSMGPGHFMVQVHGATTGGRGSFEQRSSASNDHLGTPFVWVIGDRCSMFVGLRRGNRYVHRSKSFDLSTETKCLEQRSRMLDTSRETSVFSFGQTIRANCN